MKIIKILIYILTFVSFGTTATLSIQAQEIDILPFEIVGQDNIRSGWSDEKPNIAIVANPDELATLYDLVGDNDYQKLHQIDYDRSFAVAVFHGSWGVQDSQTPAISVEQIQKQDNMIHISATATLIPLDGDHHITSPYQIIKIDKEGDWGVERTFALQLDDKDVVTRTHYIPNDYLPFENIHQFSSGGLEDGQSFWESEEVGNIVVSTSDELSKLQNLVTSETMQTLQTVDYEKQFVIGLYQGLQGNGGYAIEIEQIRHQLGNIEIDALLTEPTGEAPTVITSPYHVIKLDKKPWWNKELTFTILSDEQPILTQTHAIPNGSLAFEGVGGYSSELWWQESAPRLIIANTARDADGLRTLADMESIDYSEYFVAALFLGLRNSGGYGMHINRLRYVNNRLVIYSNTYSPFVGDRVTLALTSPYQIIKIPRTEHKWDSEIDVDVLFNGTRALTQTQTISPPSELVTLQKEVGSSGWNSPDPYMEIITAVDEISKVEEFISADALAILQQLDYGEKYAAIVFQGEKTSTRYGIEIEQIRHHGSQVVLESVATTPPPDEPVGAAFTSPYHLVQVDNIYERGRQIDFVLDIDGQHIMTQTRTIPDLLSQPSTLQGNFYPLTGRLGYEITLENRGQQTAQNVRLAVQTEYNDVEYTDGWQCDNHLSPPHECQQYVGHLDPGQTITRTFSFYPLPLPLIQSAQSCGARVEFKEPVVSAKADSMAVHYLSGTGESVFANVVQGIPCRDASTYLPLIIY